MEPIYTLTPMEAVEQVKEIARELERISSIGDTVSVYELFTLAIKIQENILKSEYNEFYATANVIYTGECVPSALEKIGMELKNVSESISEVSLSNKQ